MMVVRDVEVLIRAWVLLLVSAPLAAQEAVFQDGFEWADTSDWSRVEPLRCDHLESFDRGLTPNREVHVATWGDDMTGDGSQGSPFASIERGVQSAVPGSAVRVHAGSYGGGIYLSNVAGTAEAPIWIGGAPGEARPKLVGGTEGLHLTHVEFVVIHDLEVEGASANGINCDDGGDYHDPLATHHVTFRGLSIHDIGGGGNEDCLKLSGVDDYWVLFSDFANCGGGSSGSGVDHVGCHDGLIARNRFHELSGNAVQSKGGSRDIEIRWNRFYESGARSLNLGGSTGFDYFRPPLSTISPNAEARNIRLVSNVIEGSDAAAAYVGCVGCVVVNNTIVDPHNWILRILQETTSGGSFDFEACRDGLFVNNLVYFERGDLSSYVNIGPDTESGTFTFANNLWYAWDNPALSEPSLPVTESNGLYGLDPELGPDFGIRHSSPAAGAGIVTSWTWGDIEGACYTSSPSIGALEAK